MLSEFTIHNDHLSVTIKKLGAELSSVKDRSGFEFMWQAGEVWPRHAPNLFPIVGSLLDHEYVYNGKTYPLSHHGFARDMQFDMLHQSEHSICLILQHTEETLKSYPFKFTFLVTYRLENNKLYQSYRVINDDNIDFPVSFGGHPAFNASPIEDYSIQFSSAEEVPSNQLSGPYIGDSTIDILKGDKIKLNTDIFNDDALIFQGLKSQYVTLMHNTSQHSVKMDVTEYPYVGIWAKPGAPYVCIEPWQGLADFVDHNKNLEDKKGMVLLPKGEELKKTFSMEFSN